MEDSFAHLGNREVWDGQMPFGLSTSDRRQHTYVVGKTGTGKSTLLRNLILSDIEAGRGVGVIDPHGDLALDILDHFPPRRADDLVYFNPTDLDHPVAFNLLAAVPKDTQHLVVSAIVGALKSIWRDSWGPRLEFLLSAGVAALLDCNLPNITLLSLQRMLSDDAYRRWITRHVKDPVVRAFWVNEFEEYDERFRREIVMSIQNKIGALLMSTPLRNILGQVKSKIDIRFMMDDRRVLIANLSKGMLGEEKSNLLGAMLVSQFQHAAMQRANVPVESRTPFYLHIDEFQNFTSDSFASILSESRKWGLAMTLVNQHISQLRPETAAAVFGNVGNLISFRVGESDAAIMAREYGRAFVPETFADLPNHHVLVRNLSQNQISDPFRATTLPPSGVRYGRRGKLIARSRERFTTPRALVERRISQWLSPKTGSPNRTRKHLRRF